jgi:hypothetical protein
MLRNFQFTSCIRWSRNYARPTWEILSKFLLMWSVLYNIFALCLSDIGICLLDLHPMTPSMVSFLWIQGNNYFSPTSFQFDSISFQGDSCFHSSTPCMTDKSYICWYSFNKVDHFKVDLEVSIPII